MSGENTVKERRAIKVRINPTPEQEILIHKTFGCTRFIWNNMLMDNYDFYIETEVHYIPTPAKYKAQFPFLKEVDSLALCNVQKNLEQAFKNHFDNPEHFGWPNVKSKKHDRRSYTTNNQIINGNATVAVIPGEGKECGIRLPKLGVVPALVHRQPMEGWKLKSATVSQSASGKYFCSLLYEFETEKPQEVLPSPERTLGLDYSSPKFYVDHEGNSPERRQYFRESEKKLARLQRQLSRMVPGSKNYMEQKKKIQELHEHIASQRKDFAHQESRRTANAWDAVCVEDINLSSLSRTLNLGKSTLDNGFGMFREFLKYKLEEQGKHLIKVDRWYPSSKTCHACGFVKRDLTLKDRIWVCPVCGAVVERDTNAGLNIRDEGLRMFYAERTQQISEEE